MISFERTLDYALIKTIITNPKIYPASTSDFSPPAKDYVVIAHPLVWYVLVKDGDEVLGVFTLVPDGVCWEVHTSLLPVAWGKRAKAAANGIVEWIFNNTICQRIVTSIPDYNSLALQFARGAGMIVYGYNDKSFLKNGVLHARVLLGISREV